MPGRYYFNAHSWSTAVASFLLLNVSKSRTQMWGLFPSIIIGDALRCVNAKSYDRREHLREYMQSNDEIITWIMGLSTLFLHLHTSMDETDETHPWITRHTLRWTYENYPSLQSSQRSFCRVTSNKTASIAKPSSHQPFLLAITFRGKRTSSICHQNYLLIADPRPDWNYSERKTQGGC